MRERKSLKVALWIALAVCSIALAGCPGGEVSNNENASNNEGCSSTCVSGETRCYDETSVLECVTNAEGCREFSSNPIACPSGQICQAGECKREDQVTCSDECTSGAPPRCNQDGELESCADHDFDGCLEYGGAMECGQDQYCDSERGKCLVAECTDECAQGDTQCQEGLLQTCRTNEQGCLAFLGGKECPVGEACMGGECVESTNCDPECVRGESTCSGTEQIRECVENGDGCLVLDAPMDCGADEVCEGGECVDDTGCTDECPAGATKCVGNKIATCEDSDNNGCLDYGNVTDCPNVDETCQQAAGSASCESVQMSVQITINEVFYDRVDIDPMDPADGSGERDGDDRSPNFIELYGPAGASLAGYQIDLVNGSNGMDYGTYTLPTDAKLDGSGYAVVVADTSLAANYFGTVLPFFTNVYPLMTAYGGGSTDAMQNGPDNVVLRDAGGTEIDAVGYQGRSSAFAAGDPNFVGEGSPAVKVNEGRSLGRKIDASGMPVDTNDNSADFISFYPTPGGPNGDLLINELYVDQPSVDDGSETFVEIVAPLEGWIDFPLDDYVLHAINGNDGMDYIFSGMIAGITFDGGTLSGAGARGYAVVCNIDNASSALLSVCEVPFVGDDFQNGPDNFTLTYKDAATGQERVVDAVGYGNFGASDTFVGEGSAVPLSSTDAGESLARWPLTEGSRPADTDDNQTDFSLNTPSPGMLNPIP